MVLGKRRLPFEVPNYSLTGDILSFRRCGLQYRYYNGSALPPSRPVQLWTGEFVHAMLEEAYLYWRGKQILFPWPCNVTPWPQPESLASRLPHDLGELGDTVEARLRAAGMVPRNRNAREWAYRRVEALMRILAPHLFPLITSTEERISGTRKMPALPTGLEARGDRYELTGVVDVISHFSLEQYRDNLLAKMIIDAIPSLPDSFDVIVDYKAARRPPRQPLEREFPAWELEAWQVRTYAWLRRQQPGTNPVAAALVVYVNELCPSQTDLLDYLDELKEQRTDVIPESGSADYYALHRWTPDVSTPVFSDEFLLRRAVRIIGVSDEEVEEAVSAIDDVVAEIETCALRENQTGQIPANWPARGEERDCVACDFRRFCEGATQLQDVGASGRVAGETGPVRVPRAP